MGDDEHELFPALQQGKRALLVDARVFNFIDKHDGAVADERNIRNHQRAGLAAAEQIQAFVHGNRFGRNVVGDGEHIAFADLFLAAGRVQAEERADGGIQHEAHILAEVRNQRGRNRLPLLKRNKTVVEQHAAAGHARAVGQLLDIFNEAALAAARVADDGAELTAPQGNLVKRFGVSGLITAGKKGEGLHRLSL